MDAKALPPGQEWAVQRRLEDLLAKIAEKYGDLTGRVEVTHRPEKSFDQIGGLKAAKASLRGFATALTDPELYRKWGITPPKGVLLYGPPGTGKSLLARALASVANATFYHLKLQNLTSKFGPNVGDLLQEILTIAVQERLRPEQRFATPRHLAAQVAKDLARVRKIRSAAPIL